VSACFQPFYQLFPRNLRLPGDLRQKAFFAVQSETLFRALVPSKKVVDWFAFNSLIFRLYGYH
jgi:hypothetical protein